VTDNDSRETPIPDETPTQGRIEPAEESAPAEAVPAEEREARESEPRTWLWVLLAILVAVGALVLVWLFASGIIGRTAIPDLRGRSLDEARSTLTSVGLKAGRVRYTRTNELEAGVVAGSLPAAGTRVRKGTVVDIVYNVGANADTAPYLTGLKQRDAETAASELGFSTHAVDGGSTKLPIGTVASQDPAGGSPIQRGDTITIVVVANRTPEVRVPNVMGLKQIVGVTLVHDAGLRPRVSYTQALVAQAVVSQYPPPNKEVPYGSVVDIVVSLGPPTFAPGANQLLYGSQYQSPSSPRGR
jgi:eukaryotic-like serine/threonine-protein kinase